MCWCLREANAFMPAGGQCVSACEGPTLSGLGEAHMLGPVRGQYIGGL